MSYKNFGKERFKYFDLFNINRVREKYNLCINSTKNVIGQVRWGGLFSNSLFWLFESLIDGLVVNYCLWVFLSYNFNFKTILACGVAVKYLLYIVKELKGNHGQFKKIHKSQP